MSHLRKLDLRWFMSNYLKILKPEGVGDTALGTTTNTQDEQNTSSAMLMNHISKSISGKFPILPFFVGTPRGISLKMSAPMKFH